MKTILELIEEKLRQLNLELINEKLEKLRAEGKYGTQEYSDLVDLRLKQS